MKSLSDLIYEVADLACSKCDKDRAMSWECHNCGVKEDAEKIIKDYTTELKNNIGNALKKACY